MAGWLSVQFREEGSSFEILSCGIVVAGAKSLIANFAEVYLGRSGEGKRAD